MGLELRLYQDRLRAKSVAVRRFDHSVTALYVVEGALKLACDGACGVLGANSAWQLSRPAKLGAGSLPTIALRWELVLCDTPPNVLDGNGVDSRLVLSSPIPLERGRDYLLRCDRVDFPPGGVAFTHTHAGAGTRCVLFGDIRIQCLGAEHAYGPLAPWFEAGVDPVFAVASVTAPTAFARVMILPRELLGRSSISYVNPEDVNKPKSQSYQVFLDEPIELAGS